MNIHEEAFVKAFIQADRQDRFLSFLMDATKRVKFIREFDHLKNRFLDVVQVNKKQVLRFAQDDNDWESWKLEKVGHLRELEDYD